MTDFWAIRKGDALHVTDAESAAAFAKLPFGKPVHVEVRQPRNGKSHRLFWTLVHRIADAVGSDPETVADVLKLETGHFKTVRSKKYGDIRLPKSISYAAMDDIEFRAFFDRCLVAICENWGIQMPDVLAAVEDLIVPTERR